MPITMVDATTGEEVARFGTGRYSPLMEECFRDAQSVFGLEETQADKLAREIASEIGAVMKNCPLSVKASKLNKEGRLTLSEAAKMKNVSSTRPIMALRSLQWAAEAGRNGFSWKNTKWEPVQPLKEYFAEL